MKTKRKYLPILLLFLLPSVHAYPGWIREGAYVTYKAFPYTEYNNASTAFLITDDNHLIKAHGNVSLTFNVTQIINNTALVKIELKLEDVEIKPENKHLKNLTFSGTLLLYFNNMTYKDGSNPTFFIDPENPPRPNQILIIHDKKLVIKNVTYPSEFGMYFITYRGKAVHSLQIDLNLSMNKNTPGYSERAYPTSGMIYESSTGILICSWPSYSSELRALGIKFADFHDMLAYHRFITLRKRGEDFDRRTGAVTEYCGWLYSTNIPLPLEEYTWVEKNSKEQPLMMIGLVLAFIVLLLAGRRWKS